MNAEVTSRLAPILERARIACEAAEQCRQRTTKIVLQSCVLMQRFEELERTMTQTHHRTSNRRKPAACSQGLANQPADSSGSAC